MEYMPVFKERIPYSANFRIAGSTFTFSFYYNIEGDFFTVDLEHNGEVLARGEKITYLRPLFLTYLTDEFPLRPIIPYDLSKKAERVGWNELENEVFLFVLGGVDDVEA